MINNKMVIRSLLNRRKSGIFGVEGCNVLQIKIIEQQIGNILSSGKVNILYRVEKWLQNFIVKVVLSAGRCRLGKHSSINVGKSVFVELIRAPSHLATSIVSHSDRCDYQEVVIESFYVEVSAVNSIRVPLIVEKGWIKRS